jgi:hypothetical protein
VLIPLLLPVFQQWGQSISAALRYGRLFLPVFAKARFVTLSGVCFLPLSVFDIFFLLS